MSGAMESRAAVFTSQPQAVEVYQAGAWWAGELLGWRHESDGSCQVWVRVVLGDAEETAWTDLAALRLPERHLSVAPDAPVVVDPAATQELPRATPAGAGSAPSRRSRRERSAELDDATAGLPAVRDLTVVAGGDAPRAGGRRRAPETAETLAVVEPARPPRAGGRRRAPETSETPLVAAAPDTVPPGRHRAAHIADGADPGRHRAADTGLIPAVAKAAPIAAPPAGPSAVPAVPPIPSGRAWVAVGESESALLTRPMRLSDHIPHARRPRLGGSLAGA